MSLGQLPDLGKIGKRIRKRLWDIFEPSRDNGPSREERLARRLCDSLKGLVYFDNFDEIKDWTIEGVDPVQQANTPLLERPASQVYDQNGHTTRILLCHDYSGGYHEWEGIRPKPVQSKPYSLCIPPASWINTCHRNGVKILGTFLVEGDGQAKSISRMFDQLDGEYVVAKQLACMARVYGFDGWLLNIEAEFPYSVQHPISNLTAFIRSLKRQLGRTGTVIWYDAITNENEVDYQNALTWKNVDFGLAADFFFTNYKWNVRQLHKSTAVAEQHGIQSKEIYFGIDCWAQNTNMAGPPRITYPPKGGGGTLTGLATHVLAENKFSSAIFAPGWPYEHFSSTRETGLPLRAEAPKAGPPCRHNHSMTGSDTIMSDAEAVEYSMWEGRCLPDQLSCDCKEWHPHHRSGYRDMPIVKAARQYPAGSASYFETNFQQAFCPINAKDKSKSALNYMEAQGRDLSSETHKGFSWRPEPGCQAILPHLPQSEQDASKARLLAGLRFDGSSSHLHLYLTPPSTSDSSFGNEGTCDTVTTAKVSMFKLDLATDVNLTAVIRVKTYSGNTPQVVVGLYTKAIPPGSRQIEDATYPISPNDNLDSQSTFLLNKTSRHARLVEVGLYCQFKLAFSGSRSVLDLYELIIKPTVNAKHNFFIQNITIYHRSSGNNSERRLRWTWKGSKDEWPQSLPWSSSTGPFSVFSILADGRKLGQAHCLEFPLRPDEVRQAGQDTLKFTVKGHFFGGGDVLSIPSPQPTLWAIHHARNDEPSTSQS